MSKLTYDVDGYDVITNAIQAILNQYPGLDDEEFSFATLSEDAGLAMYPDGGAVIEYERISITDHVSQDCIYPFTIAYRAGGLSENRKVAVKEWLDKLGRWLEKQTVTINGTDYTIDDYPQLTGDRVIKNIRRTTVAYLESVAQNNVETWVISLSVKYHYEFDR